MPVYIYRNLVTNETFEYQQRITEDALSVDPRTGDPVRRVIQPVGIAFKGSGFYVNDNRAASSATSSASSERNGKGGSASESTGGDSSGDASSGDMAGSSTASAAGPAATPAGAPTTAVEKKSAPTPPASAG